MVYAQITQSFNQVIVIGRAIAQEHDIGRSRPQGLQAVGKFTTAAGNL